MSKAQEIYKRLGPEKAFGNPELIAALDEERKQLEWFESTDECPECRGEGEVEHDCLCRICTEQMEECRKCWGKGRIEKKHE
jgi:hypothetical protein